MDTGGMESYLQKAIQLYEAPSKYGNENGMANWWQGLTEKFSDKDTYLLDIPEMFLTAGAGAVAKKTIIKSIVKSGNKALAKRVARAFGDEIVEAGGKIALKEVEKGAAERVARGVADDVLMTAFMPTTWSSVNEDKLDKYLDGEDYTFKDFMRSFTNSVIETGTERWGGKIVDKTLGKVFSPIDKIWGKTSWGSMLTNNFIQSPFGETGEEYVGAVVNYLRSFNPLYDDKSNAELRSEAAHLFSGAGFVDTMLTVLPVSLFGGGANVAVRANAEKNASRYKQAYDGVAELFIGQGATTEQAIETLTQIENSEDSREFAKKLSDAYGILTAEFMRKNPSKEEYDAFAKQLDKVFGEYVKAARKMNISAGELQDMYNELSKEEKADVQAKVEEIAKPIAEAIPAEQQPQAAEAAAPAPEQPVVTEEKKEGKTVQKVEVDVNGQTYTVTGSNIPFNEDGSIQFGRGIYIKDSEGHTLIGKQKDDISTAINQELAAKKQEAAEPLVETPPAEQPVAEETPVEGQSAAEAPVAETPVPELTSEQQAAAEAAAAEQSEQERIQGIYAGLQEAQKETDPTTRRHKTKQWQALIDKYGQKEETPVEKDSKRDEILPIGTGDFGNIYDQFRGKTEEAIVFLSEQKSGEALGALSHPDIGEIDLVWGEAGTGHNDGYGLAKLAKYHPEVLANLQEIINDMQITSRNENRIQLESERYKAAVRLTWNNESKTWLLTALRKKSIKKTVSSTRRQTLPRPSLMARGVTLLFPKTLFLVAKIQQKIQICKFPKKKMRKKWI